MKVSPLMYGSLDAAAGVGLLAGFREHDPPSLLGTGEIPTDTG